MKKMMNLAALVLLLFAGTFSSQAQSSLYGDVKEVKNLESFNS